LLAEIYANHKLTPPAGSLKITAAPVAATPTTLPNTTPAPEAKAKK